MQTTTTTRRPTQAFDAILIESIRLVATALTVIGLVFCMFYYSIALAVNVSRGQIAKWADSIDPAALCTRLAQILPQPRRVPLGAEPIKS